MLKKEFCMQAIKNFKAKQGLEASDQNVIATIHLMNAHGLDIAAALDQSSRSGNDHGIDAWHYDEANKDLFIYQSKLTESRNQALRGLDDLDRARQWVEQVVIEGTVDAVPSDNHCLFSLYRNLGAVRANLKKVRFALLSLFDKNEIEDCHEYVEFGKTTIGSKLNAFVRSTLNGKVVIDAWEYNLEEGLPARIKLYPIPVIPNARIDLRKHAHLDLAYVSLYGLVQLYRQRGDVLFDKNVRLSLIANKEARERLRHPMDDTLTLITSGKLSPSIFPFYHVGVTIAASSSTAEDTNTLGLEAPSIINGCQTITIANEYLKGLERNKNEEGINLFKEIKVVGKIVVGTSNEELKEITNSNNRQNPIENWQLFSNEPIHIEIEAALKDKGIFYERQKGKFDAVMKIADNAQYYTQTNRAYIKVADLGQLIALSKQELQWAAKPSEIFLNKANHDRIFDRSIPKYSDDIVFGSNLFKAMKRGLGNYLKMPSYTDGHASEIFKKQTVKMHLYDLTLLHFYQDDKRRSTRADFSIQLNKIASPRLTDEVEGFYRGMVAKVKNWYTVESKSLTIQISNKKLKAFFDNLAIDLGVDAFEGARPFSPSSIDWSEYRAG